MALGAVALFIANILWLLAFPTNTLVFWWAGFLILTIAGERLELGRMIQLSKLSRIVFYIIISLYLLGLVVLLFDRGLGVRISGLGVIGLSVWLLRYDIARRTIKQKGLDSYGKSFMSDLENSPRDTSSGQQG